MGRAVLVLVIVALAAGCGGGGTENGETAAQPTVAPTPTEVQTLTVPDTARLEETPDGEPAFTVALTAPREAKAGAMWRFTVKAIDQSGQPASGTAKMRVFADGELVDTLGWFPFEGTLQETHRWPRSLVGKKVVLQAEVEGAGGTQRKNLPVSVSS